MSILKKIETKKFIILILFLIISWIFTEVFHSSIIEVPEAEEKFFVETNLGKYYEIMKFYIITNPPTELHTLKEYIVNYHFEHPIINNDIYTDDGKRITSFILQFYRESFNISRHWKPNLIGYFDKDRPEDHARDCIASIIWMEGNSTKEVHVMEKSRSGDILQEEKYAIPNI